MESLDLKSDRHLPKNIVLIASLKALWKWREMFLFRLKSSSRSQAI